MNLTNQSNLPLPLVEAIRNDSYDKGDCDYSVTELILPPRIAELRRQHWGEITEDASDRIFALVGQGIHAVLERAAGDCYRVEERFTIRHESGVRVSGRIDLYDRQTFTLQDYKVTSRWTTKDGLKPEWVAQGNLNRLLMLKNGVRVDKIEYVAIYRDWSKMMVARGKDDMPEKQVETFEVPLWKTEFTEGYLEDRIRLHQEAAEQLPLCTDEERWFKPEKWAVMKKGRKRAVKLYDSPSEATLVAESLEPHQGQYKVEHRKGEHTRCLYYCPVSSFCLQFREYMQDEQ
jgi:hypothetical protein